MIEISLRIFIIKILFFIYIKPPLCKRFGRHSTTDIPYTNYILYIIIKQANNYKNITKLLIKYRLVI